MTQSQRHWGWTLSLAIAGALAQFSSGIFSSTNYAWAQPVPDNTLGSESSVITPNVVNGLPSDQIDGGAMRGSNLFHSFREFSINENRGAYFTNPAGIENILSRVTSNSRSDILGRLGVLGNANLFLINPNGIVFGPNARLDVNGSFVASTANRFTFPNGSEFSATNPQAAPLLTVNVTPGLQYGSTAATIANRANLSVGQDLTLAAGNLDVQGTLQAGRNLTLQAQDTVQVRDTATNPLIAVAGGRLQVQGSNVDIFALNHPNSGFWSGGDLVLRSSNAAIGDAHFHAGGNFRVEQLDGSPGSLLSPNDPIIFTNGDVTLGDYIGASLHILAGGSVTLGTATITGTGDTATTINPNNTKLFNGSKSYADLARFNLTEYRATLNSDGTVRSVDSVLVPITIDGSQQPTVDIRAGVDWAQLGGLPTGPSLAGTVTPVPNLTSTAVRADITLNGKVLNSSRFSQGIRIEQPGGLVLLTNQFSPNNLPGTITIRGNVDTSTRVPERNGGDIRVYGRGDITIAPPVPSSSILLNSSSDSTSGTAGNGGAISFATNSGTISLTNSDSFSSSSSPSSSDSTSGTAGNGGAISFATNSGTISLTNSDSFSSSSSPSSSFSTSDTAGNGGAISFATNSGNIFLTNSDSFSRSRSTSGTAGNGGAISFATNSGTISLTGSRSNSSSDSSSGTAGNGGAISFTTHSGNIFLTNSFSTSSSTSTSTSTSSLSLSSGTAGNGGAISFTTHSSNISLTNSFSFSTSDSSSGDTGSGGAISFSTNLGTISLTGSFSFSTSSSTSGTAGNGGAISFSTNLGTISLTNSFSNSNSSSFSGTAGSGGAISFATHSGNIFLINSTSNSFSRSSSSSGTAGNGGAISFSTNLGNISLLNSDSNSYSTSSSGTARNGGAILFSTNLGNISLSGSDLNSTSTSTSGTAGNGGAIRLSARSGTVSGRDSVLNSFAVSQQGGSGNGGKVTLEAGSEVSGLTVNTVASSDLAGDVEVTGFDNLQVANTRILTAQQVEVCLFDSCPPNRPLRINLGDRGQAGNVKVSSIGNLTFSNSAIESDTRGGNPAGNITFQANGGIEITNRSTISARTSSGGQAGSIRFDAPTLVVAGNAQVLAETSSSGAGGSIFVTAPTAVDLRRVNDFSPVLSVQTSGAGRSGDIVVNTQNLTLSDQARITATATATATNLDGGGSITLNASTMNLAGIVGVFAETQGQAPAGTLRLNPYNNQPDLNVTLAPSSQISASTSGSGNGGDLIIQAPRSIALSGPGKLAVEATSSGNAGNIEISTGNLTLTNGVEVSASSSASGKAGNVNITANNFDLSQGAKVTSITAGSGAAGNIVVNTNNQLLLTGNGTGLFASTTPNSTGAGGSIFVDPIRVSVLDSARIAVDSQGQGNAGILSLQAGTLLLDRGTLLASTASGEGGNIDLTVNDLILLRNRSLISAQAGGTGKGGNIAIDSSAGFIVAAPDQDSDIIANAFQGQGGGIQIKAQGIFGLEERRAIRGNGTNDIDASSEFGIDGVVENNTPDVDPNRGLVVLPTEPVETEVAQGCQTTGNQAASRFVITGRGGLPPNPSEALSGDAVAMDLVTLSPNVANRSNPTVSTPSTRPAPQEIVEAQGWIINSNRDVILVAQAPATTPDRPQPTAVNCSKSQLNLER
ncbi:MULTISPECIES: filamentous hemagglutinin N-terminal domain-containing protein [Cyanophyceae]|uniref:Filamentous hemagglutinin N-terminal domain-containing protein n=1 Tax=Stenomitos frigidus AS-A4 TaxID=2933935 RepID=A0ABV0KSL6_9CYAN|nr:filamentous hemagglutinin N-terminal domain-containing protein [Phormidium sp. FACHB-592]